MLSPKFPQVLRYLLIALVPTAAALVTGCPFGDQTGSNGDSPGQPVPPEDIELEVMIEGQGTVEQEADGSYVTLTAVPDAGWYFQQWFGSTVSKHNPLTVQATEDTSIGALFLESESQVDTDSDGVPDGLDQCPDTPSGAEVDENGCAASQQDSDEDGVSDDADQCPGTATGSVIDGQGCAANQRDSDGDGVKDDVDRCSNTSAGASVDALGCAEGQRDNDGDGIANDLDQCPDTASGTSVDNVGCPLCDNGVVDTGEECDNGSANSDTTPNACRTDCTSPRCGDGVVDAGEDCDPPDTSTCDSACQFIGPANDDCDDPISVGDGSKSFSNERASTDGPEEGSECAGLEGDVWFCYTASCDGTAKVSLCNINFDTIVAVYAGCACPTTNPVMCDDDGCGTQGGGSEVTFTVSKDALYLIRVGGFNGATGSDTLTITCQADGGNGGECESDCDDGNACTEDTCAGGSCVNTPKDCDDDDACTEDSCEAGVCTHTDVDCDDGDLCTTDSCDSATGCLFEPVVCDDDGVFCNGVEACDSATGECVSPGHPCDEGENCDEANDECRAACSTDADCDDDLWCNGLETCPVDMCQPGATVICDDGVGCTDDSCNEDTDSCDSVANDANCDDGQFCNGGETCDAVNDCQPGTAEDCDDGVDCTVDSCNTGTDSCDNIADDAYCDDGQFCNGSETCDAVNDCQPGTAEDCDDGVDCTDDSCNTGTDSCDNIADDDYCDDGLWCNGAETCDAQAGCQTGSDPCPGQDCNEDDHCVITCSSDPECDDGLFCNGTEFCVSERCTTVPIDCIDVAHCDEENNRCLECLSADECDDGDLCTNDACTQNECLNIDVQCAPGVCNPDTGECVDCLVNTDCQNGLFCDGDEGCSPALECQPGEDPCDDGIGCTIDICYEQNDSCENAATGARCPDDELFCNGEEYCNPVSDCTSTGDPCDAGETCNEELDRCEVEPATWISTQLLFPGFPGYKAPESHELDGMRDLVVAHLGLSEDDLLLLFDEVTILATSVPIGVETEMYQAVKNPGDPFLEESTEQSVTITTFHLSIRSSTPTWTFDYIVVEHVSTPMGTTLESRQFFGTQTGDITANRDEITWTSVDGSFQRCTDGNCGPEKPLEELIPTGDWTLGTWTKQE